MWTRMLFVAVCSTMLAGCHSATQPRDLTPPAAPRGVYSVTGDGAVWLSWFANTEADVAGYRVYEGPCASGPDCPYVYVGTTTGLRFRVGDLANGVTRYFAVAAFDYAGNESPLSYEDVFDTPRPEGFGLVLTDAVADPDFSGWDFSTYRVLPFDHLDTDIFFAFDGATFLMLAAYTDTDIQDAGYTQTLDQIDWAPSAGWSPTGAVEVVPGHSYVVWTHDDHYAKFRVTSVNATRVILDWAYQVARGNPELGARRASGEPAPRIRRVYEGLRLRAAEGGTEP